MRECARRVGAEAVADGRGVVAAHGVCFVVGVAPLMGVPMNPTVSTRSLISEESPSLSRVAWTTNRCC